MKKVWLKMYLKNNLGDDLFLKVISERYPKTQFYVQASDSYLRNELKRYPNITIYSKWTNKIANLFLKAKNIRMYDLLQKKCDLKIILGGSMFIENKKENGKDIENIYFKNKKPYYIIGSNFGPYQNDSYKEKYEKVFETAEDVCFRDEYSYRLFQNLKNIRKSSDILFTLSNIEVSDNGSILISVIDLENREELKEKKDIYEKKIIELCNYFTKERKKVILMSFCASEKDEKAIHRIYKKCRGKSLIKKYFYRGKIEEAIKIIAKSHLVIGTRFHACILGLLFHKTIIPISYSDKTLNVLNDLNFEGKRIDIHTIEKFEVNDLTKETLDYKVNVDRQIKEANDQFRQLDKILK